MLKALQADDELVYNIAWDLPDLLLGYFLSDFDFDGKLGDTSFARPLLSIFSTIVKKGNPKELNLKALETLSNLTIEGNYNAVFHKGTRDDAENDEDENVSYIELDTLNLPADDVYLRKQIAERYLDLKFVSLFELATKSLFRVETLYPSRFLAPTTSGLLAFLANNLPQISFHGLIFVVRRLYMFPRDFEEIKAPPGKEVSESEIKLQVKLLQSFITFLVYLFFSQSLVKWSHRLYIELRRGVAVEPDQLKRERFYLLHGYTEQMEDLSYRLGQLAYSFDLEVEELFADLVKEYVEKYDKRAGIQHDADDDNASETSTIQPDALPFDFQGAKVADNVHLSKEGIFLLGTQSRFINRKRPDIPEFSTLSALIKVTREIALGNENLPGAGVKDALCFWALWMLRNIKNSEQLYEQVPNEGMLIEYLQVLTMLASQFDVDEQTGQIIYSIVTRILALATHELRYKYLVDTIESCPFPGASEVAIKMLKDFLVPPKNAKAKTAEETKTETEAEAKTETESKHDADADAVDAVGDGISRLDISKASSTSAGPEKFNMDVAVVPEAPSSLSTKLTAVEEEQISSIISQVVNSASSSVASQLKALNQEESDGEGTEDEGINGLAGSRGIDFGLLAAWANFLTASPLSAEGMKKQVGDFKKLVLELKQLYANETEESDPQGLRRQTEMLDFLVQSFKA